METLIKIQNEIKVPKGNFNSFGKYKYRSCEDILEAAKPILLKHKASLIITDTIEIVGTRLFLKATTSLNIEGVVFTNSGFAEMQEHKGMSLEQCTGAASSYARKYALNGLFLIDETQQDPDNDNIKPKPEQTKPEQTKPANKEAVPMSGFMTEEERNEIIKLLSHPLMSDVNVKKGNEWLLNLNSSANAKIVIQRYIDIIAHEEFQANKV